jgi:hypothetical protein
MAALSAGSPASLAMSDRMSLSNGQVATADRRK